MKGKILLTGSVVLMAGWFALASGSTFQSSAYAGDQSIAGSAFAQNDQQQDHRAERDRGHQWYQGQQGRWQRNHGRWEWRGAQGDQWFMGEPGHWYDEGNGWQFGSQGTVCNNQGRDCRQGCNVPA